MAQPSYLTTRLSPLPTAKPATPRASPRKLRQVPGVAEAVVIAEEKLAYLKVDSRSFDAAMAEFLAGRLILSNGSLAAYAAKRGVSDLRAMS